MICSHCNIDKPASQFNKNGRNEDGTQRYLHRCKSCSKMELNKHRCDWHDPEIQSAICAALLDSLGLTRDQVRRYFSGEKARSVSELR